MTATPAKSVELRYSWPRWEPPATRGPKPTLDQQMQSWLRAHVHAFEHFAGIPALVVPDNIKTGVTKTHRYDPDLIRNFWGQEPDYLGTLTQKRRLLHF